MICAELAPGERRRLKDIPGWNGPLLVAAGPDGSFEREGEALPVWRVPVPTPAERVALWQAATGDAALAEHLGPAHRHACARIAELARAGRYQAELAGADRIGPDAVAAAARSGTGGDLGMLAELLPETIPDEALVLPAAIRRELESLIARCLARDALADALGPASRARYRPGVRALFVGPSGTGKTLAVGWLATRLGLPLYRVDLASVTSKYIGETEKNLAQLFARAEHCGSRAALRRGRLAVRQAHRRQGLERPLRQRADQLPAPAHRVLRRHRHPHQQQPRAIRLGLHAPARRHRRVPRPGPEERRALWTAHLGEAHGLAVADLNRLAANCDLAGGHIRNVVLAAAALARTRRDVIREPDLLLAAAAEYRKLGKTVPAGLAKQTHGDTG